MTPTRSHCRRSSRQGGYLVILFVLILAFVGVAAAMQVLVLTSVATTSRAFDTYQQTMAERRRFERVVVEALFDQRQVSVATPSASLAEAVNAKLALLASTGATVSVTQVPAALPSIEMFPTVGATPDPLVEFPDDVRALFTPELAQLCGQRGVAYSPAAVSFASERTVLDAKRRYGTEVTAQLVAVPLTHFPIAAYELPADIGKATAVASSGPTSTLAAGLVPARDPAFIADLQAHADVLPYHYRHRAALAGAYQYVFSQAYADRVAEYAGVTHYCDLDATDTAALAGMSRVGDTATWDLGIAGVGTYQSISATNNAAVVFANTTGKTLRLVDSVGNTASAPLLLLILGPANASLAAMELDLTSIARPVVIVAEHVRVVAASGTAINGALLLDPECSLAPGPTVSVGHLSYWAGSTAIPATSIATNAMPATAEEIAPRAVFVAARSASL